MPDSKSARGGFERYMESHGHRGLANFSSQPSWKIDAGYFFFKLLT
jgi:hypothetical protein